MSVSINDIRFNNNFRTGQNLPFLLSCIGEKFKIAVDFSYQDITYATVDNALTLEPLNSTVNLADVTGIIESEDGSAFTDYFVGDTIKVYDKLAATTTQYTISEKIDNGIIRVSVSLGGNKILDADSFVYNNTPFSGLRYAYNLIDSGSSFNSLIDGENQQAESDQVDASDVTVREMEFTGELSYQIGSVTIQGIEKQGINGTTGGGNDDVKQLFTLIHNGVVTPLFLANQYNDLLLRIKPTYFDANNTLNYIAQLSLGRDLTNPNRLQEIELLTGQSNVGWFNERFNGGKNNYSISSLILTDVAAATTVSRLEFGKEMQIDIIVDNTADAPFSDTNTNYTFGFNYLPEDSDSHDKNGFDQTRNFAFDSKDNVLGNGSVNGDNIGNNLQIIKTLTSTYISATQMKITVLIQTASDSNAILQQGDFDRYQFWLITENHSLSAEKSDKVNLLVDVNEFYVQQVATNPIISSSGSTFIQHPYTSASDGVPPASLNIFPVDDLVANLDFSIDFTPQTGVTGVKAEFRTANAGALKDGGLEKYEVIIGTDTIGTSAWEGTGLATLEKLRDSVNTGADFNGAFQAIGQPQSWPFNGATGWVADIRDVSGLDTLFLTAPATGVLYNSAFPITAQLSSSSSSIGSIQTIVGVDAVPATTGTQGVIIKNIQSKILLRDVDQLQAEILLEEFNFSTANFPVVGNVQDIDFSQDRAFKVPDGIRKTITCIRDYASDTADIKFFNYKYPFMHRWEHWESLLSALTIPNELFDNTQPNNGINHFWHRYTTIGVWHIIYDVVFTLEQNGVEFTQTFSSTLADSADFEGNTDWSSSTIKSYDINTAVEVASGGVKYLKAYENVELKLDTLKTTGVLPPLANVGIVAWIETFEEGGISNIRRLSSYYVKGDNSWFESSDSSDKIVVTKVGNKYTGTLDVDYTKFPAAIKFTIYARLYEFYGSDIKQFQNLDPFHFMNGDPYNFMAAPVGASPLILGNAWKQDFQVINSNPVPKSLSPAIAQEEGSTGCCFTIPALAQTVVTDELKNDKHSPYFVWNNAFSSAVMVLEKYVNGAWTTSATLNDNTYGTFNTFGFYITKYQESAIGYNIEWSKVLNLKGIGKYRVRFSATPFTGGGQIDKYSFEFCLDVYTDARANRTTRWSWWTKGVIGDRFDDEHRIDYGPNEWFDQIRLPSSFFGKDKSSEHEKTFNKYQTGEVEWIEDSQVESYTFTSGRYPDELHRFIKINIFQADDISVTDYNSHNANVHVNKKVTWTGTYEPDYPAGVARTVASTDFKQAFQNLTHKRC